MTSSFPSSGQPPNGGNPGDGSDQSTPGSNSSSMANAAALIALLQQQQQQQSGTNTPNQGLSGTLTAEQMQQQQDLRALALQQQLAALMQAQQQQQQAPPGSASSIGQAAPSLSAFMPIGQAASAGLGGGHSSTPCSSAQPQQAQGQSAGGNSALLGFYQQLLALQQAHQQQQQSSTPTVAALPQQFSTALHLQNSPASVLPQQLAGAAGTSGGQPAAGLSTLLNGILSNPTLIHSLLGQQQQQQNPLLAALTAQLLLPGQQQQAQQPQAQLTASLLQMLNPATATLYAYQNYLQQQQQPQPQPASNAAQLQLLVQLLTNGGSGSAAGLQGALTALNGNQQQTLLAALAAQQAQQQAQQHQVAQPPPDENRLLLEQLIKQNREQQQLQQQKLQQQQILGATASRAFGVDPAQSSPSSSVLASVQQQPQFSQEQQHAAQLQHQHSANELIVQQLQQQQQAAAHQQQPLQLQSLNEEQSQLGAQGPHSGGSQQQNRNTPNERLLTSEAVQDRISRLISENEAIVEPNPVLLKRRPYQRQGTSNSMTSQTSETAGTSQRGSPGIRSPGVGPSGPKMHPATTRSYSLHEASFMRLGGGSLTSGQPINRQQQQQLTCNFCQLKFPNEAGLEAHESRCSKKEALLQKQQSQPQLKFTPTHQQQQQQQLQLQLQQLQEQHQSTIAALVGGGKGVARDLLINGNGGNAGGRASVPSIGPSGACTPAVRMLAQQQKQLGQSSSDSRLKKRGLEQDNSGGSGSGADSVEMIDVVSGGPDQQPGAESSKMARIEMAGGNAIAQSSSQPTLADATLALYQQTAQAIQQQQKQQQLQLAQQQQQQPKVQPQQAVPQPVLTMRDAIIFAITYSTDLRSTIKMPYFLTLTPAELDALAGQGDPSGAGAAHFRGRTRNITSETFVCLNKVRPTASEHRDNCSAYSIGCVLPECPNGDERIVQLFLSACSSSGRPRPDQMCGQYTLAASRESLLLRTTHSSFWSQQQQKAQLDAVSPLSPLQPNALAEREEEKTTRRISFPIDSADGNEEVEMSSAVKMEVEDKENSSSSNDAKTALPIESAKQNPQQSAMAKPERKHPAVKPRFELNRLPLPKNSRNEEMEISTTQAMVQVYIRGRGRGRYVCERCGIRCKKPSMLKKHLRSHTNVRPFTCLTCNFSFKTKGNLTKHLVSKAHRRRMLDGGEEGIREDFDAQLRANEEEDEGEGRLVVAEEEDEDMPSGSHEQRQEAAELERRRLSRLGALERKFVEGEFDHDEDDDEDWDDEEDGEGHSPQQEVPPPPPGTLTYRRFGQENILVERETHTPPTLWTLMCPEANELGEVRDEKRERERQEMDRMELGWPQPEDSVRERGCHSAPPAALCSPDHSRTRKKRKAELKKELEELIGHQQQEMKQESDSQQEHQQQQQPPLANFIPQVRTTVEQPPQHQQQFQQPSLAAQLAAGLFQNAPFHQPQQQAVHQVSQLPPPIGIAASQQAQVQQQAAAAQQLLLQLTEQQQQQPSAFAPPAATGLVSALKMLENAQLRVQNHIGDEPTTSNGLNADGESAFTHAQSTLEAFLEVRQWHCDMCERKFRKESELQLHRQTHLIERNQRQKSAFQCVECPTVVRSKSMLARHSESAHGRSGDTPVEQQLLAPSLNTTTSQQQQLAQPISVSQSGVQSLQNPTNSSTSHQMLPPPPGTHNHYRNFLCTDCNLGFRSHGVLAKHLRSKNHVKTLISLGKLGDDANMLIRDHSKVLGSIDASNCQTALHSTKQKLAEMREQLGLDGSADGNCPAVPSSSVQSANGQMEQCREPSPIPSSNGSTPPKASTGPPRISSGLTSGLHKRPMEPLPHGLKRKNNEAATLNEEFTGQQRRDSFSSPSPQRPKLSREDVTHQAESPLHSLAQVAVAAAAAAAAARQSASPALSRFSPLANPHHQKTMVANVWVPPKLEQLIHEQDLRKSCTPELHNGVVTDRLCSLFSNRSAEETSESTGTRSESSTPIQRLNAHNHVAGFSPLSAATRCQLCDFNFESPAELAVHFHADHVVMRHGRDFRCSRRNCEKVFPSRESLRAHIHAHFFSSDSKENNDHFHNAPLAASCPASPSLVARRPPVPSAPPPCSQSPGVPEESHSAISQLHSQQGHNRSAQSSFSSPPSVASNFGASTPKNNRGGKSRGSAEEQRITGEQGGAVSALLCCQFCAEQLPDVQSLQAHWVRLHLPELTRPHVCVECDAGFTSEDALRAHQQRQHSANGKAAALLEASAERRN